MPKIKPQTLDLGDAAFKLRYTPLAALDVGDYIDDYADRLRLTGVFDHLTLMGSGVTLDDLADPDLATIGLIGTALTRMLSPDGGVGQQSTRTIVLDHCARFGVQVYVEGEDGEPGDWVSVDNPEAFNAHLGAQHMLPIVKTLGGEALRPLWSSLASKGGAEGTEPPKSSPATSATS